MMVRVYGVHINTEREVVIRHEKSKSSSQECEL